MAPRAKSFDQKADAEKWARSLESELDRCCCVGAGDPTRASHILRLGSSSSPGRRTLARPRIRLNRRSR